MNVETALVGRAQVERFQRKHRVGLVTLLFTDVADSTRLKQDLGDRHAHDHLLRHDALIRETLARFNEGEEISRAGDSFFMVFTRPSDAVKFSLLVQHGLVKLAHEPNRGLRIRIGLHVGEVLIEEPDSGPGAKDLYGIQVDICSRVLCLAHAGQILMTRFAFDCARQALRDEDMDDLGPLQWMNHGRYRLKGVEEPMEICAVGEQDGKADAAPRDTDKGKRFDHPEGDAVLGWRPGLGQVVPKTGWVLEQMLGEGGFGEVWLAKHQLLGDHRVFKFCFHADRVRSLKREVKLFRLMKERFGSHAHIVGIQDVLFDEPPYYLVMDYAEAKDLRAWCEERGGISNMPLAVRLEIVAQAAEALQAAHDAGVIHRDVKPGNILVSGPGTTPGHVHVRLTDFGIGQVVSEEVLAGMTKRGISQTTTAVGGGQTGTQLYMAPELIAGKGASTSSDVYALGVVLYQFLVGDFSLPLTVDWREEIQQPDLRENLARCFAGNPQQRFARIAELGQNLRTSVSQSEGEVKKHDTALIKGIPPRAADMSATLIDLTRFYNAALEDNWCQQPDHNLAALPHGRRVKIAGAEFDPRGIVQLGCVYLEQLKASFPRRVNGIPIRRKCSRFHFLHASVGQKADGTQIGSYFIHHIGGQQLQVPIVYGEDIRNWLIRLDSVRELKRAVVAWAGRSGGQHPVRLFKLTWQSPLPDEEVTFLDFHAVAPDAAPFLIAVTVE